MSCARHHPGITSGPFRHEREHTAVNIDDRQWLKSYERFYTISYLLQGAFLASLTNEHCVNRSAFHLEAV